MPQSYDVQHKGCAIICGAAPCVFEDLESALKLRPGATIVGVNNAAAIVPEIEHIWTQAIAIGAASENGRGGYMRTATTIDGQGQPISVIEDYSLIDVRN